MVCKNTAGRKSSPQWGTSSTPVPRSESKMTLNQSQNFQFSEQKPAFPINLGMRAQGKTPVVPEEC
ncbi:hypothetical protein MUG91_G216n8 [Manis pentadactyla]|nr:hypothetical protein MUG91_G216n8 [Manis pentadactyla]